MTKGKTTKANSNQQKRIEAADWLNWEIRDFQYQVELFKTCGGHVSGCSPQPAENHVEPSKEPTK